MTQDLIGKTALVTGSTSGIGLAIAKELHARGANVMFTGMFGGPNEEADRKAFEQQIAALREARPAQKIDTLEGDITRPTARALLIENAAKLGSGIDILVNNAGIHPKSVQQPFQDVKEEDFDKVIEVNQNSVIKMTREALKFMPQDARIINITSVHGLVGSPTRTAYVTAKHAVEGFTKTLGNEGRVQANTICPAFVETELAKAPLKAFAQAFADNHPGMTFEDAYKLAEEWRLQHQDGKWISESTIAEKCADLASGAVVVPSGESIRLDNGYIDRAIHGVVTFKPFAEWAEAALSAMPSPIGVSQVSAEAGRIAEEKGRTPA